MNGMRRQGMFRSIITTLFLVTFLFLPQSHLRYQSHGRRWQKVSMKVDQAYAID